MTQTIYGLICDAGDGSASMRWYRSAEVMEKMLLIEDFYQNEGSPAQTLTFPATLDLEDCGFSFCDDEEE